MDIRMKLHPNQSKVWLDDSRFRILVAGRRFGKTTLAIHELFMNAMRYPNTLNVYAAPTYRQAKQIAWLMLKDIVHETLIEKTNESELTIVLTNKSRIELKGCDNPDSLRGVGIKFLVVDEYAMMPNAEELWGEVLRPMLIDSKGRALFIGTPKGLNHFYTLFQRGVNQEDGFKSFRFSSYDNPYLSKDEIDKMKEELPPRMFEQEVETSFLVSSENILIKIEDIEDLKGVQFYEEHKVRVVTCDPATMGGDECIIYVLENTEIVDEKSLHYTDTLKIAGEIVELANRYKANGVAVDSVGIGKGVYDHVASILRGSDISVIPINSGEKSTYPDRFNNRRTEMWWHLWELIKDKKVRYIEDLELKRQLSSVEYQLADSTGKVKLVRKDKTKEMLGRSPDRADAYVYGIWALQHVTPKKPNYYKQRQRRFVTQKGNKYGWDYKRQ